MNNNLNFKVEDYFVNVISTFVKEGDNVFNTTFLLNYRYINKEVAGVIIFKDDNVVTINTEYDITNTVIDRLQEYQRSLMVNRDTKILRKRL